MRPRATRDGGATGSDGNEASPASSSRAQQRNNEELALRIAFSRDLGAYVGDEAWPGFESAISMARNHEARMQARTPLQRASQNRFNERLRHASQCVSKAIGSPGENIGFPIVTVALLPIVSVMHNAMEMVTDQIAPRSEKEQRAKEQQAFRVRAAPIDALENKLQAFRARYPETKPARDANDAPDGQ